MAIMVADLLRGRVAADRAATSRLASLDSLRGLAALSVVACHYLILLADTPFGQRASSWLWLPPLSLIRSAYGAVILFFVLSGYVLALSLLGERKPSWGEFAARRFFRIWPPYAATILISFAIGHLAPTPGPNLASVWQINTWHSDDLTVGALVQQIGMASSHIGLDVPAWSLVHELRISLAFPLLLVFVQRAPATTLAAAFCLCQAERLGPPWLSYLVPDTATYIVYFAAGAWLALHRSRIAELGQRTTAPAKALLCAIALVLLSAPTEYPGAGISTGLGAVLLIVLVTASPAIADILSARWCVFLGRISYSLYLTHIVVLMGLGRVLGASFSVPLILAVAAPIIGLVGWIGYRWVEQPSIRLGRIVHARFADAFQTAS